MKRFCLSCVAFVPRETKRRKIVSKYGYKKIFLLLLVCLLCFAACAGNEGGESADGSSLPPDVSDVSKDASQWVEGLDSAGGKYKGKTFKVISTQGSLFYDDSETPVSKEVMNRNGVIEQVLSIDISTAEKTAADIEKGLRAAIAEGKPYADLICAPADVLARLGADGLLENLYSLPYISFEAGYVNKVELEGQTVGDTMYMMSGTITMDVGATVGLFYNKQLLASVGVDPYKMAKNGNWTWDDLITVAKAVSNGTFYGVESFLSDEETLTAIYTSCGGRIINSGTGKSATPVFDDGVGAYAASVVRGLFKNGELAGSYADTETAAKAFNSGKLGFVMARLDNVGLFDGAESEWGLILLPKYSTSQTEYCSPVCGNVMAIAVPKGADDSAFSGFVLNALLAASTDRLDKALKQTYVNYHFWSNDAALMLERIGSTKAFDLGVAYSSVPAVYDVGVGMLKMTEITALPADKSAAFAAFAEKTFN